MAARITKMAAKADFNGDQCIVLPKNYLQSAEAAAEIYEDELADVASNLDVDNMSQAPRFFRGTFLATVLWAIPSVWTICQ